jgi:hypothetical protein
VGFVFEVRIGGENVQLFLLQDGHGVESMDPRPLHDHVDPFTAQRIVSAILLGRWMGSVESGGQKLDWLAWSCELINDSFSLPVQPVAVEA